MVFERLAADALALIRQLEAQNAKLSGKIGQLMTNIQWMEAERDDFKRTIQQLGAERDAAVAVIRQDGGCNSCLYSDRKVWEEPCLYCEGNERWQWRGVQKEE